MESILKSFEVWSEAQGRRSKLRVKNIDNITLEGINHLRELIFELAIMGKLVRQDPSEEPATELLKKIKVKKKKLIKDKFRKEGKELLGVSELEIPYSIPKNWVWTRLGEITQINPKNEVETNIEASFVSMSMVSNSYRGTHEQETRMWNELSKGFTHFADGDIGLAKITPCFENGKAAVFLGLVNGIGAGTTELHIARPIGNLLTQQYVLYYLKSPSYLKIGESKMTGTAGQKRVSKEFFSAHPFPLPPLAEQKRIVAKVNELMVLCDKLKDQKTKNLKTHQQLVTCLLETLTQATNADELQKSWEQLFKHFDKIFCTEDSIEQLKQAILQLAVMGKIVRQDPKDEPASVLLKKINDKRRKLIKNKIIKEEKTVNEVNEVHTPYPIPENWIWTRLGEITQINPRNEVKINMEASFVPMSMISTSYEGKHEQETRMWNDLSKGFTHFAEGDVGLAKITPCFENSKAAIFSDLVNGIGAGTTELHIARPIGNLLAQKYVLYFLKSPFFLKNGESKMTGTAGQKRVPKEFFGMYPFPLPPLVEQNRIIAKVEEIFDLCDKLRSHIVKASGAQSLLSQTVLLHTGK